MEFTLCAHSHRSMAKWKTPAFGGGVLTKSIPRQGGESLSLLLRWNAHLHANYPESSSSSQRWDGRKCLVRIRGAWWFAAARAVERELRTVEAEAIGIQFIFKVISQMYFRRVSHVQIKQAWASGCHLRIREGFSLRFRSLCAWTQTEKTNLKTISKNPLITAPKVLSDDWKCIVF